VSPPPPAAVAEDLIEGAFHQAVLVFWTRSGTAEKGFPAEVFSVGDVIG
jgi:hypothetical protein